jgi:signal transduction histidine kinase
VGLKAKLILIILSVALLPPLTIAVQLGYQLLTGEVGPEIRLVATRLLGDRLPRAVEREDYSVFGILPRQADLVIVSDDGKLLYASSEAAQAAVAPAAAQGPAATAGAVAAAADNRDFYAYRYNSARGSGTAYLTVPGQLFTQFRHPVAILPIVLLSLLATVSLISALIVRNLGKSIHNLEEAMRRISAGDLDFPAADLAAGDLASLGQSLDRMRSQLKEDGERRDRFIMGVSHDLKTPLSVIQGYLEALDDGLADSEEKKERYLKIMRAKADLLEARIAHLIELAKTTTTEWRNSLEDADFGTFLEETLAPLAEYCAIRGRVLERHQDLGEKRIVSFDRDMIARVFENLVENAVAYGDRLSPITVDARADQTAGSIIIRVENGGPGISEEDRKKVFEPFFRGDKSRKDGGFGLGLASVKSIVESHGWTIRVESEPGSRTAFIMEIPTAPG